MYVCYSWRSSFLRNLKFMSLLWVIQMWSVHHVLQAFPHLSRQFPVILLCWIWLITWLNSQLLKIGWRRIEKPRAALLVEYLDECIWLGFWFFKLSSTGNWSGGFFCWILWILRCQVQILGGLNIWKWRLDSNLRKHLNLKFAIPFFFEKCKHKISELPSYIQHSRPYVKVQCFRRQVFWNRMLNCWWGIAQRQWVKLSPCLSVCLKICTRLLISEKTVIALTTLVFFGHFCTFF